MKLNLKKFVMTIAIMLSAATAFAYDFEVDGIYYNITSNSLDNLTCSVTSGDSKYEGHVEIPSSVFYNNREISVIAILGYAFYKCTSLTSVTIPNPVEEIGSYAFYECNSLSTVTIPNSVKEIGSYAFYCCNSLSTVSIPNSVKAIYNSCFCGCSSLSSVSIPNSVEKIGDSCFSGCRSLSSVTIPNSIEKIEDSCFSGCRTLSSVTIPNSVKEIGDKTFYNCSLLSSVEIPESVTEIGTCAFENCSSLESIIIPNSVVSIHRGAFRNCSSLRHITLSDSLEKIDGGLFENCIELEELVLPGSIEEIIQIPNSEYSTFKNCNNLKNLSILYSDKTLELYDREWYSWTETIKNLYIDREIRYKIPVPNLETLELGTSIKEVQIKDFSKMKYLTTIKSNALFPPKLPSIANVQYMNINVIVPEEALAAYQADPVWGKFWNLQGISEVDSVRDSFEKTITGRYDLSGKPINGNYKGMVIVRYSDGSAKKIFQ